MARSAPVASSTDAPTATSRRVCDAIEAHNANVLRDADDARRAAVESGRVPAAWLEGVKPMVAPCFPWNTGSAWAVKLKRVDPGGVTETHWSLVHIDRFGTVTGDGESVDLVDACCSPTVETGAYRLFDLDGDGDPEIAFDTSHEGPEGDSAVAHHVYTFKAGRVVPFPVPGDGQLSDVDGDGRMDVLVEFSAETNVGCNGWMFETIRGPSILAHGTDSGVFSTTDEAARAYAQNVCPAPPRHILTRPDAQGRDQIVDAVDAGADVVCARVWGRSSAEIEATIEKVCKPYASNSDCSDGRLKQPFPCRHAGTLKAWADSAPIVFHREP